TEPVVGSVISRVKISLTCVGLGPGRKAGPAVLPEAPAVALPRARSGNKKERVPGGPLSIRDRMRTISCGGYSGFSPIRQGPHALLREILSPVRGDQNLTLHSRTPPRLPKNQSIRPVWIGL